MGNIYGTEFIKKSKTKVCLSFSVFFVIVLFFLFMYYYVIFLVKNIEVQCTCGNAKTELILL